MKATLSPVRNVLKYQAWIALLLFALATFAAWCSFRSVGAVLGENGSPSPGELLLTLALIGGGFTWQALRQPRQEVRAWLKVRLLWDRGDWVGLFGFSCTLLLFGAGFGVVASCNKWFHLPAAQAVQFTLTFAVVGGLLGFFGGLAIHLPGANGWVEARRTQ